MASRIQQPKNSVFPVPIFRSSEEFKLTLPKSLFVSQKLKPYGKDMKKPCAYKLCGEIGHNHKENKDEYPHKRRITQGVSRRSS